MKPLFALQFCLLFFLLSASTPSPLRAGQETSRANSSDSAKIEAHIGKGYQYVQDNQYMQAAQEFQAALSLNPALMRIRYQLAVCYLALQQLNESRQEFARLQKETAGDASLVYHLGRLDLLEGDLNSAIKRFESIASDPPFPDTAYYLGSAYLKDGKLEKAEHWLKKAVVLNPRDFRIPDHLARVYMKAARRQEAEQQYALSSELRKQTNEGASHAMDCTRELASEPLEKARQTCQKLFVPGDPDKLSLLGMIYGNHEHFTESIEPLEQAARLDPDTFEIQHNLGLSYFRLKRFAEARKPLELAVSLRPDFFGSNALLGATLFILKEDEAAYPVLEHAFQLNPQDPETIDLLFKVTVVLAHRSFSNKQHAHSLAYLQKAVQLRPEAIEVHRGLAEVYTMLGQRSEAEREKREIDRLDQNKSP